MQNVIIKQSNMHKEEYFKMANVIKRVISVALSAAVLLCAVFISASAVDVTSDYDSELSGILSADYSPYLTFASGSDSGTLYYYDVISAGNGQGNMGSIEKPNQRYNYVNFDAGKEFNIKSKTGFTATNGFTASFELFTNVPSTGTVALSFGQLRFEIDYAATTLFLYYGDTELGRLETGYEAGSYDFQIIYLCNQWTIKYIDGAFTVIPVSSGLDESKAVIKNEDNTPLSWTLPDGTVTASIPAPDDVDFGYCYVELYATKEISKRCVFSNVPVGFTSAYNGNFPLFSNVDFTSNCGFSTLSNYVNFVVALEDDLNEGDVRYAREVFDAVNVSGSDGLKAAVAEYESYIISAEAALLEGVTSDYNVSATKGGSVYSNGAPFVNDSVNNPLDLGAKMSFTAVADTRYTFSHWANGNGGVVSRNDTIDVAMGFTTVLTAVFVKDSAQPDEEITVIFRDRSGNVISTVTAVTGTGITLPNLPFVYGYTCTGWLVNGVEYAAGETVVFYNDTVVSAAIRKNDTTYSVKVSGSEKEINGSYTYNTPISVTFDRSVLKNNEIFAGWANGDVVVSYDEQYSFFVGSDVELTAVVTDTETAITPIAQVTDVSIVNDGTKASFLTERWLPEGYTLVSSGAIYTNESNYASKLNLTNVNGTSIRQTDAKFMTSHGQFRMNIGSKQGAASIYLVAYVTYVGPDGTIATAYSPIYSAATTAAVS